MNIPRIMISATASGSGKTQITCGLLQAFVNRGLKAASFKCGPDYIDPMFHTKIIGTKSRNLDSFFTEDDTTRYLLCKNGMGADISLIEGVMGFYDGISPVETAGSSYALANITRTPVILVVNCSGMSLSIIPMIQGFLKYREDSQIKGVILNQMAESIYPAIKVQIELELGIKVIGYVPVLKNMKMKSRHLGLVQPDEIKDYHKLLNELAHILEQTLSIDDLLAIAEQARELSDQKPEIPTGKGPVTIGVAQDEAFCFYYEDNLELLREMGATIQTFSPLHDKELPPNLDGVLLGGGYPELNAKELSQNVAMRNSLKMAIQSGLPCMAECGGFMYLHEKMEDMNQNNYEMVGLIEGTCYKTNQLKRFGYCTMTAMKNQMIGETGDEIKAHEFHYFESTNGGDAFQGKKAGRDSTWNCIHGNEYLIAGFPHLYYYSDFKIPQGFLNACFHYSTKNKDWSKYGF